MLDSSFTLPCGETIQNRIVKSAMSEYMADKGGAPHEGFARLYNRWAMGGVGLNITGNVMIDRRSREEHRNTIIEDRTHIDILKRWASEGQQNGTKLWVQLNHPGRQARGHASSRIVSASDVQIPFLKSIFKKPEPLTEEGIQELIRRFGETAEICKEAGFGGVQIHGAHGYLVSQFLSPITNRRVDQWGGNLENRARFLLSIYSEIRDRVGTSFPMGVKINSADFQRGGFTEEDSLQVIRMLSEAGIDLIEISGGTYENPMMVSKGVKKSTQEREAFFADFILKARQHTKTPLLLTGGFRTRSVMEAALQNDELDFIGIARPFAVNPDLPNQLMQAEIESLSTEHLTTGLKTLDGVAVLNVYWYADQMKRMAEGKEPDPKLGTWGTFIKNSFVQLNSKRL